MDIREVQDSSLDFENLQRVPALADELIVTDDEIDQLFQASAFSSPVSQDRDWSTWEEFPLLLN